MIRYRIVLKAEDGFYTLKDNYLSYSKAEYVADKLAESYGDGQSVYVEQYELEI